MLNLALLLALAGAGPTLALPPWPLSPDGDWVAVRGDAPLQAEGARVSATGEGLWSVSPLRGRLAVRLRAGGDEVVVPVAPPPGAIAVTFDPAEPIKGRDARVRIALDVRDAAGAPLELEEVPQVVASTGTLGPLARGGAPGRYEAVWVPAATPAPETLGIVAFAPRCPLCATPLSVGGARLPVAAAIELPGRSDPGVETRVEIGGRSWGPVRADATGRFVVPVVVPPGTRWGSARSQSAVGNERRTRIDLQLSEAPGFVCAAWPRRVPAAGAAAVGIYCTAWSASGAALDPRPLRAVAGRGRLGEELSEGGLWSARYWPPAGGSDPDRIALAWGPAPAVRQELVVELASGEPASIDWKLEGEPFLPGTRAPASARAVDRWGTVLGEAAARDGMLEGGALRVRPELGDGIQILPLAFALPPGGRPALLSLHRVGREWVAVARDVAGRPVEGLELRFGAGDVARSDRQGEARSRARGEVETVAAAGGLRAIAWSDAATPLPARTVSREVRVALRPADAVDLVATLDGRAIRWRVLSPDGRPIAGRTVRASSASVDLGGCEPEGDGGRCPVRSGRGTVTVIDVESGTAALLEVR